MKTKLFLLHFAGGNCYSFRFLQPYLRDFNVIPLELPGRNNRIAEFLLSDLESASKDIYNQISNEDISSGFLIYGHSMGALLALKVSYMLEHFDKAPAYLILTGYCGPGIGERKHRYLLEQKAFKEELKKLGGVPDEFIKNDELFEFYEPILRADFEIAEKEEFKTEVPLSIPIYAMMGNKEEKSVCISNWQQFTRADFNYEIVEGNHFFIYDHAERIAAVIKNCFSELVGGARKAK